MSKETTKRLNTPQELLDHLKEIYKPRVPNPETTSDRKLWMSFGNQQVVEYLEKIIIEGLPQEDTISSTQSRDLIDELLFKE